MDDDDLALFNDSVSKYEGFGGQWQVSSGAGLSPGHSGADAGLDNRFGWRGYWYDSHLQMYHVRNRDYDPRQGQWLQTDPLGFAAGDQNLYRYADGNYSSGYDPEGLEPWNEAVITASYMYLLYVSHRDQPAVFDRAVDGLLVDLGTRSLGVSQAAGGGAEVMTAGAFGFTGVGLGVTLIGGLHGLDNIQAGLRQAGTGEITETITHYALQASLESYFGVNSQNASRAATVGDIALSFISFNWANTFRSVRQAFTGSAEGVAARLAGAGGRLQPAFGLIEQGGGALAQAGAAAGDAAGLLPGLLKCNSEVAKHRLQGLEAEGRVPGTKNTIKIGAPSGRANYRIPDRLNRAGRIAGEIKDVRYQYWSSQLDDILAYAKARGYKFEIWLRKGAEISEELAKKIRERQVIRRVIPDP
ncbi:MAG: RHS repeat-associated core domain-containing protein [Phycisphaerales bacterium]